MKSSLQYPGLNVTHVRDPLIRRTLEDLDRFLRALVQHVRSTVETDPQRGISRTVGHIRPREVSEAPDAKAAYGRDLELVTLKMSGMGGVYQKIEDTAADTQWSPIQTGVPQGVNVLFYNQETEPTPPQGTPAIWWRPTGDGRMELYVWMRTGTGIWAWSYYGKSPLAPPP